jgi:hypothetical protein
MKILPIIKEEAEKAGYTLEQILEENLTRRIAFVRQYAMWRARKETKRSFPEIALVFKRDPSTVIHACQKFEKMSEVERLLLPETRTRKKREPPHIFLGKPCKHGHGEIRYFSNLRCVVCERARKRKGVKNDET